MKKPEFDWGAEFDEYLASLNKKDQAKLKSMIAWIEAHGLQEAIMKQRVKKLENNLYEIRVQSEQFFMRACYFQLRENNYYITHGFNKKTDKTPLKERNKARKIRFLITRKGRDANE